MAYINESTDFSVILAGVAVSPDYVNDHAANAIVGNVAGAAVAMDDVSPLAHKISVNISGVDDGTEVTVRSCGKNLIHINSFSVPYTDVTVLFEGNITGNFAFSFDDNLTGVDKSSAGLFQFIIDGNSQYVTSYGWSQSADKVFTFSGTLTKVYVHTWNNATGGSLDNIQLEVGTAKTEFEPYKEGETIVAKVGEEVKLTSIAPNVTIFTDNTSAAIEATYNKDTNKVIEKLTNAIISLGGNI